MIHSFGTEANKEHPGKFEEVYMGDIFSLRGERPGDGFGDFTLQGVVVSDPLYLITLDYSTVNQYVFSVLTLPWYCRNNIPRIKIIDSELRYTSPRNLS